MLFDHIMNKYSDGLPLFDIIKNEDILKRLPKLYVPVVETYDNGDRFLENGGTVFIKESGPTKIRFLLFDIRGNVMTTPDLAYTQLNMKRAKYLARLSCSAMNLSGPNITLDYFVDIFMVQIQSQSSMYTQKRIKKDNTKVTEIIEDYTYHFISIDPGIAISPLIGQFDMNRDEILNNYFK